MRPEPPAGRRTRAAVARLPAPRRRRGRALARALGALALLALGAIAFTPVANRLVTALVVPPRLAPADAIVVLGAGLHRNGEMTGASLRRAVYGLVLYRRGLAPVIVFSGPAYLTTGTEAGARASLARALGVPREAIGTLTAAMTTREEAREAAARFQPRGVRRVLLVTSALHMPRAAAAFARVGFDVLPAPTDDVGAADDRPEDRLRLARFALGEIVARAYYRAAGWL